MQHLIHYVQAQLLYKHKDKEKCIQRKKLFYILFFFLLKLSFFCYFVDNLH